MCSNVVFFQRLSWCQFLFWNCAGFRKTTWLPMLQGAEGLWETTSGEGEGKTSQGFTTLNIVSIDETFVCFGRPLGFKHMVAKIARVCAAEDHVRGGGESSKLSLWKVPLCSTLTLSLSNVCCCYSISYLQQLPINSFISCPYLRSPGKGKELAENHRGRIWLIDKLYD